MIESKSSDATRPWLAQLARDHPGLLLSAAYLVLTLSGLMYEFWFFRAFGISIVEYVETSDFLLAAIRTPLVIVLAFAPLILLWLFSRLSRWLRRKSPTWDRLERRAGGDRPETKHFIRVFFVLIYAFVFIEIYAVRVTDRIKEGHGREVHIELASGAPPRSPALLLGTTAKFVFLYVPASKQTHIIPIENVARLVVAEPKERQDD